MNIWALWPPSKFGTVVLNMRNEPRRVRVDDDQRNVLFDNVYTALPYFRNCAVCNTKLHRPPLVRNEATCHRPYILVLRFSQKLQIS